MTPTTEEWRMSVRTLLRAGFGVEDIALKLKCSVETVRRYVKRLREAGELREMFG